MHIHLISSHFFSLAVSGRGSNANWGRARVTGAGLDSLQGDCTVKVHCPSPISLPDTSCSSFVFSCAPQPRLCRIKQSHVLLPYPNSIPITSPTIQCHVVLIVSPSCTGTELFEGWHLPCKPHCGLSNFDDTFLAHSLKCAYNVYPSRLDANLIACLLT